MSQITVSRSAASLAVPLMQERATLQPFTLAFRNALAELSFPGHTHFLEKVDVTVETVRAQDRYHPVVRWWDGVTQYIRLHPDVETFRTNPAFYPNNAPMSEVKVDALFRVAQAIDDGEAPATVGALIAAFEAEDWN